MFDKFAEKLLEGAMSTFTPKMEEMSKIRANELLSLRAKIRTQPEEVESWFDREISLINNIDLSDMLKRFQSGK
jgi:hypothetical protein